MQRKEEIARLLHQLDSLKNKFPQPTFSHAINFLKSEIDVLVMMASGLLFFDFQSEIQEETQLFYTPTQESHDAASFLFS